MFKSIIKRIIVAVGVIVVLKYLESLFGVSYVLFDVYAEESIPVQVQVPSGSSDELVSKDGIYSNVFTTETENSLNVQYYIFGINPNDCDNNSCPLKASPYPSFNSFNFDEDIELPKSDYQNVYNYSGDMLFSFMQDLQLEDSSHYTFFYLIRKNNNSIHFNRDVTFSIGAINCVEDNSLSEVDISDYVFNLVSDFHVVYLQNDVQSQYMYLKIEFDTGDNFTNIFNDNDVFLSSIYVNVNKPSGYVSVPIGNFLTYPGDSVKSMAQYTYFIKNGRVNFTGVDCNNQNGVCHSGVSYGGAYDSVMTDDIDVLESIPVCSDTITSLSDVVCHIKRVFEMIFKFFTRISNLFLELLMPHDNLTIADQYFDTFHLDDGGLAQVVTAPLEVIQDISASSCESVSFTLPQVNQEITFPCLKSSVYLVHFSTFFAIYQVISTGCICYFSLMSIFNKIRQLQNPDANDKIEVINL